MGPLQGIKVVELVGTGPGPFAAMVLADLGADVIRLDRIGGRATSRFYDLSKDVLARGRRSVAVDLKHPSGRDVVLRLVEQADALIEPYRPGVAERLGIGPDECMARNPLLVYGRMTGWGQHGPYADRSGHDVNYLALNGVLGLFGRKHEPPVPPVNLLGDFGGGAMFLVVGILAALWHVRGGGSGQVLDVAMIDGAALLAAMIHATRAVPGAWGERGTNILDTGAPFYEVYETADGGFMSVGAIEPQFYRALLEGLGLADQPEFTEHQMDTAQWPAMKERFREVFLTRSRDEWVDVFLELDACVAPVLSLDEASAHPQLATRGTYVDHFGVVQPAPAPRFSVTEPVLGSAPPLVGQHTTEVLMELGLAADERDRLLAEGAVRQLEGEATRGGRHA